MTIKNLLTLTLPVLGHCQDIAMMDVGQVQFHNNNNNRIGHVLYDDFEDYYPSELVQIRATDHVNSKTQVSLEPNDPKAGASVTYTPFSKDQSDKANKLQDKIDKNNEKAKEDWINLSTGWKIGIVFLNYCKTYNL